MAFSPLRFRGADLPALLAELARRDPDEVLDGLDRNALHPQILARGAMLPPPVEWRTTWFVAPDPGATRRAPDHPPVSATDVELDEYLGGGKQGAVYAGRVRATGLVVAVKVIHGSDAGAEEQAVREARVAAKVNHPNVLRVFYAERAGAFWVVVMEFLQGQELSAGCPAGAVGPLAARLSDAVLALARARVVHRDIKPANVVVRGGDRCPVLVDFGLALDLDDVPEPLGLAGTPLYMAPEACRGGPPDPTWDAYSLGVTVVALVDRSLLPRSANVMETIRMKQAGAFDERLRGALGAIPDARIREWCVGMIGPPDGRLALLERASRWRFDSSGE